MQIIQPRDGFRAGIDAVLLAASVPAEPGNAILELGCGVGSASLCLAARVPGLEFLAVELQHHYADLARQNAKLAGLDMVVVEGDVGAMPADARQRNFDHVLANPPYYLEGSRGAARDTGRDMALAERIPLDAWVETAARRLVPGGMLTVIQSADRLPDLLSAYAAHKFGAIEALPLIPRPGRPARLVILRGRKGRKTPFKLLSPVCLHDGPAHVSDKDGYSAVIDRILKDAEPLNFNTG